MCLGMSLRLLEVGAGEWWLRSGCHEDGFVVMLVSFSNSGNDIGRICLRCYS